MMMRIFSTLIATLSTSACLLQAPTVEVPAAGSMRLDDVVVINPVRDRTEGQTITIRSDRITAIDASSANAKGPYSGMYVLPGLIDMHTHYPSWISAAVMESTSLLFLAHGVTTIRDTGAQGRDPADTRRRIRAGEFPGPRLFFCGPAIDGNPPTHPLTESVDDAESARDLVEELATDRGVDCIKVYSRLPLTSLRAVREVATKHGLTLVGHVPAGVSLAESELDDAQHLYGIGEANPISTFADVWGAWDLVDEEVITRVIHTSLDHEIAHTPTLVAFSKLSKNHSLSNFPPSESGALPLYFHEVVWHEDKGFPAIMDLTPRDLDRLSAALPKMRELVARMHRAGVQLHVGSDCFMPHVVPGESTQLELAEFVSAGIPLEEVWAIATRHAGDALGMPGLGRIEPKAPADLLVFRDDPTADLAALDTLELVIADGRAYSRETLEAALAQHAEHVRSWPYRAIMHPLIRSLYAILR